MPFVAAVELIVCWLAWAYPFIMRAPHRQRRPSITASLPTYAGLLLEASAICIAWVFRLSSDDPPGLARIAASMALGPLAGILSWTAVRSLGKQFRLRAGLYQDHELVRDGPYCVVRHPIYASLLAILLSTLLLLTPWTWFAVSLVLFVAGTEIRIRAEDALLASRFGEEFLAYRRKVPAYLPFIR